MTTHFHDSLQISYSTSKNYLSFRFLFAFNFFIMCMCAHVCACVHEVGSFIRLLELQGECGLSDSGGKCLSCWATLPASLTLSGTVLLINVLSNTVFQSQMALHSVCVWILWLHPLETGFLFLVGGVEAKHGSESRTFLGFMCMEYFHSPLLLN